MSLRKIAFAAVIGALYAALTMINPFGYGPIQFRISEVLCILPFFFPFSVWGLFVGCIIANLISAYGLLDIVFGSLATLIAAMCTMYIGKVNSKRVISKIFACLPPVIFNAIFVGAIIAYATTQATPAFWPMFVSIGLGVALSEFVTLYAFGLPALIMLPYSNFFKSLSSFYLRENDRV